MENLLFFVLLCVISVIIINFFNILFSKDVLAHENGSYIDVERMVRPKINPSEVKPPKINALESEPTKIKNTTSSHFTNEPSLKSEKEYADSDADQELVTEAMEIIQSRYQDPYFSIEKLADNLKTSKRNLQRKFKQVSDTSPSREIRKIRLNRAIEALRPGAQIKQVGLESGFSSQSYFCKCFKESVGCTPSEFLQKESSSTFHQ